MKDFDTWNIQKKKLDSSKIVRTYRAREVWWCRMGLNVGYEQDGKDKEFMRPVLILKGFSKLTLLIVPLTSSAHTHKYRIPIGVIDQKYSSIIISQIRTIDTRRLVDRIEYLDKDIFKDIQKTIKRLLF